MELVEVPQNARLRFPNYELARIGAPDDSLPPEECGVVPALVGFVVGGILDGAPQFREYWKLTDEEIEVLKNGGGIELIFWGNQMPMHGMAALTKEQMQ